MNKVSEYSRSALYVLYIALFFLTPLIFYPLTKFFPFPWNLFRWEGFSVDPLTYELFEFNKMYFVYGITILVGFFWTLRCIDEKRIIFQKTFFDYPIVLFLISQILSTIFSVDIHTSIWGYYSRFHGGLVSTLCYVLLYWGLVSNFYSRKYVHHFLMASIASSAVVAWYGIAQHFGIDAHFWRQNVRARVFSSLGQPNWLAAYVVGLMPVVLGYGLYNVQKKISFVYLTLFWLLFTCLIFTYSRSGFLAAIISILLFSSFLIGAQLSRVKKTSAISFLVPAGVFSIFAIIYIFIFYKASAIAIPVGYLFMILSFLSAFYFARKLFLKWIIALSGSFLIAFVITTISGIIIVNLTECVESPSVVCIARGNKSFVGVPKNAIEELFSAQSFRLSQNASQGVSSTAIAPEAGGTETGNIRIIVWKGAFEIFKNYPILGSGVESFAYSFYQYRPLELLKTAEWDFLYNKAHNEFINILATTGAFGLAVYIVFFGSVAFAFYQGFAKTKSAIAESGEGQPLVILGNSKKKKVNIIEEKDSFNDSYNLYILSGLFSGLITILITNFFGFSVVNIAIFFFLTPAFIAVLSDHSRVSFKLSARIANIWRSLGFVRSGSWEKYQFLQVIIAISITLLFGVRLIQFWFADIAFAEGRSFNSSGLVGRAHGSFTWAVELRQDEPFYFSELGWTESNMVYALMKNKDASTAAELAPLAEENSIHAIEISPDNVSYWKKHADVYYNLSFFDQNKYSDKLRMAIERTITLAPTDVSTFLTLSVYYVRLGDNERAMNLLNKALEWKPDLAKAWYRKGEIEYSIYKKSNNDDDRKKSIEYQNKAKELEGDNDEFKQGYE